MGAELMPTSSVRIPRDAAGWVSLWRNSEIPVLEDTAQQLEELRAREDDVDARLLAGVVSADPLMCLKLLAHVSTHRASNRITDTETATAALVMMGIGPFFRQFGPQPSVQERLRDQPGRFNARPLAGGAGVGTQKQEVEGIIRDIIMRELDNLEGPNQRFDFLEQRAIEAACGAVRDRIDPAATIAL